MSLLDVLERQPNFPREDLTDTNASYLGLAVANMAILKSVHEAAEGQYPIFIGTHKPLVLASENLFNSEAVQAIDFGIKALEAMTLFVQADRPSPALSTLAHNIDALVKPANGRGVIDYFSQAHEEFVHEASRTAAVIAEGSARFHYSSELAIFGGAIARRFELDNVED